MPSNIPLWTFGVAFRLRLVTFTEQAHPSYRHLGGIPTWRRGSSDRSSARRPLPQAPRWHPRVAKAGIYRLLGTATLPTGTSVASSRGEGGFYRPFGTGTLNRTTSGAGSRAEASPNQPQTGLLPMLRPDFGTASPAGGLSVASRRGEAVIYRLFGTATPSTSTSVASSRGEGVF